MKPTILFLKTIAQDRFSTEDFALKVRDDPKYDNNPLINKDAIDEAFRLYGDKLNPLYRSDFGSSDNYCINVEGHFISAHLPEIPSIVSNKTCTVDVLYDYLDKYDEVTHIGLTACVLGMEHTIDVIKAIKNDFSHLELFVGGIGTLYPRVQELINQKNLCIGDGVNWIRKKFDLKPLSREEFIIPEIIGDKGYFPLPMKTFYMVTQLGCPNSCDFCFSPIFHQYNPFSNSNKIINFFNGIFEKYDKDIMLYLCDANAFYPEQVWRRVFDYFYQNRRRYRKNIFLMVMASLNHLSKFNLEKIQESPLKIIYAIYGIESDINPYEKNFGNPKAMIDRLNKLNIMTFHSFIIGFPFHSPELIKKEVSRNLQYPSDRFYVNAYKPIPNTLLYNQLKSENRIFGKELPPEFLHAYEYMPFKHQYLGYGFDILKYCFYAYHETEKIEIDVNGKYASKCIGLFEHTNSRKIKRIASTLMSISNANFKSFEKRMPDELVEKYMYNTNKNVEKFNRLSSRHAKRII